MPIKPIMDIVANKMTSSILSFYIHVAKVVFLFHSAKEKTRKSPARSAQGLYQGLCGAYFTSTLWSLPSAVRTMLMPRCRRCV